MTDKSLSGLTIISSGDTGDYLYAVQGGNSRRAHLGHFLAVTFPSSLLLKSGTAINWNAGDVTATHSANALAFAGASSGYTFDAMVAPATNDVAALGSTSLKWSDLWLASGAVIDFNSGDATITHSANRLDFAGATDGYYFNNGSLFPFTSDGASLGGTANQWSDLWLASGAVINFNAGNVTITHAAGLLTLAGGGVVLAAGTTSLGPLKFQSGTNLTTAAAGTEEFDGVQRYSTIDTTSGRGAIPVEQYFHLTADGSAISTIANFFGANSNISLVASAHYIIDIYLWFLNTTSGTVTWTLTNSAAPTSQNIIYEEAPVTGIVAPPGTATLLVGHTLNDATAALTITTGTLTTAVNHYAHIKIFLANGAGTSLKIQATKNVGGTMTPQSESYWIARRISPNNIGTFAA